MNCSIRLFPQYGLPMNSRMTVRPVTQNFPSSTGNTIADIVVELFVEIALKWLISHSSKRHQRNEFALPVSNFRNCTKAQSSFIIPNKLVATENNSLPIILFNAIKLGNLQIEQNIHLIETFHTAELFSD